MSRRSGNPARAGWDPIQVFNVPPPGVLPMARAHHTSSGRRGHYKYRTAQRSVRVIGFQNRTYNGTGIVFEDGSMHISFKRNDRSAVRDWRHFQAIKNEVAGPEREAIELFPPESQLMDGANEYHMWVLPEGQQSPLGFADPGAPALLDESETHDHARYRQTGQSGARQRGWEPGIPTGLGGSDA